MEITKSLPAHALSSVWQTIRRETEEQVDAEPILASFLHATILNHDSLEAALSYHLAHKLDSPTASALLIREVIEQALENEPGIGQAVRADLLAIHERDSACCDLSQPFLYFKGFHALQAYRIAHWLWGQGRQALALFLQNRISVVFGVDIHPAAKLGRGIMIDHATALVIGETAVVEDNVSLMHSVTLGGTGKEGGDRHPKVRQNVLISAGATILGNIEIGEGAQVGSGSVVLKGVEPHTIVAGVPAKAVGLARSDSPAKEMCHDLRCKNSSEIS